MQMANSHSVSYPLANRETRPLRSARLGIRTNKVEFLGVPMMFARNAEIYGECEPAEYIYRVISGSVRACKLLNDGRRQIGAFYLPGDMFGLEIGEEHKFSAEAVSESKIMVIRRSMVFELAGRDCDAAKQLWSITATEVERMQERILLLNKTAQERVVEFLMEMAGRSARKNEVELPMSRQDIADYLGLTIETVSRTFTQLESSGVIMVPTSRHIVLRNQGLLNRLHA